jgi:acetoin utilization protein AcuB
MHDLPVTRFMSTLLVTAQPDDPLAQVSALMDARKVHHVLVVESGRLVGILSSADLLKLALLVRPEPADGPPRFNDELGLCVRDVMQREVVSVNSSASLHEVVRALSLGGYHALPVLSFDGTPIGIVTSGDLTALLLEQIERRRDSSSSTALGVATQTDGATTRLVEVLRAADVYLHSGQSEQQHARLVRAVERAREQVGSSVHPPGM